MSKFFLLVSRKFEMTRTLQSVHIKRFKCIEDAPFDVGNVNVLVGANDSGKSSVIQALQFAIGVLQTIRLTGRFHVGPRRQGISTSLSPEELIYTPSKQAGAVGKGGRLYERSGTETCVSFTLSDGDQCSIEVKKGKNRNIIVKADNRQVAYELASLEEPFSVFSPGLAGIAKEEEYVSDGVLLRTIARGDANLVLRNTLLRLWETPARWGSLIEDLSEIFPETKVELSFDNKTDEFISAEIERDGDRVPLELSGTGLLQATQILSYIHQFSPAIILLDEPDSHLHPNNQRLLCAMLQRISEDRGTQVFLTTHSRHVVDAIAATSKFLWVRNGTVDEANEDDEIGVLLEIGALDIKERALQKGINVVVLTEDEIIKNLEVILKSSGFEDDKTIVLPYFGCANPKNLRPLARMIQENNPKAKIVVHRDRDFWTDDEISGWRKDIRRFGVEPFVTDGVDVESHLLKPDHIAACSDMTQDDAERLVVEAREAIKEECIEKAVNGRMDCLRKQGKSANTDIGKLASQIPKWLDGDPERYFHGKLLIKAVRRRAQECWGVRLRLAQESESLRNEELSAIAKKVFR